MEAPLVVDKPDYRLYFDCEGWSLKDALNIVSSYSIYKARSSEDKHLNDEEVSELKSKSRAVLADNVDSYSSDIQWKMVYDSNDEVRIDKFGIEEIEVDFDETMIDVKRFIRFARAEPLPFPEELIDAFMKKEIAGDPSVDPTRIIAAAINAVIFCLDNELAREVTADEVISDLELKGFSDINEATKQEIYALIPKAIKVAAIPLDIKDKRRYGILKNEKMNQQYVIRATVEATQHMSELPPGTEINAAGMYDWLYSKGYKELTKRMHEQIWQALPSAQKKSAGNPTKKAPKK